MESEKKKEKEGINQLDGFQLHEKQNQASLKFLQVWSFFCPFFVYHLQLISTSIDLIINIIKFF